MKTYVEVLIRSKLENDVELINVIRKFATSHEDWQFLEEESEDYTMHVGEPSCSLLLSGNQFEPLVAISRKKENLFYITNVVPKETGRIPMFEYNRISAKFSDDFRTYVKSNKLPISIKPTKEVIGLEDIIPGRKTREYFERYMGLFPTSYHFYDIRRLDLFICAVSRYLRTPIDVDMLKGYLIDVEKWDEKDAEWCANRISAGLEVLEAYRHT